MITHFNHDKLTANLPDAYRKTDDSNNHKLLEIQKQAMDKLREDITAIYDSLDLDKAYGKTLDLYGEMLGQARGRATDNQYRVLLKARIVRNLANGDYNSIIRAIAITLGCEPTQIEIIELEEPCKIKLGEIPSSIFNNLAIDMRTAIKIIKELIPAGVWLESATFSGTFEFAGGTELVYDENAGFADLEQTIGGYLGLVFDGNTTDLPV